jgi:hypothetical protein
MKIEKGKFYRTRGGEKVEVLTTERKDRCSVVTMYENGDIIVLYMNGAYFNTKAEHEADIISEWTEPVEIPWSDYPTWCKWVAMDNSGKWFGYYGEKPKLYSDTWGDSDLNYNRIPTDYQPRNFTGDWTESLFERPCE